MERGGAVVLQRELAGLGFAGGYPPGAALHQAAARPTALGGIGDGQIRDRARRAGQVDFGQLTLWIGERSEVVHQYVFTLGYSRRLFSFAYPNERPAALLDGHVSVPCVILMGCRQPRSTCHRLFAA